MTSGYNMDCEPGALGMQKCYVNVNTPAGCTTGTPGCTTTRQEVIGDSPQGLVTKAPSNSSWMAWIPNLVSLNNQGQAYLPYGSAGIPYSLGGGSTVKWTPIGADGDQALAYLSTAPGSGAREAYQQRTCNPLWSNVFGCREGSEEQADQEIENSGQTAVTAQQKDGIISSNLIKASFGVVALGGLYFGYTKLRGD